jgi:serine/threonine protein kinase/Flp pilus assembly protein TadD
MSDPLPTDAVPLPEFGVTRTSVPVTGTASATGPVPPSPAPYPPAVVGRYPILGELARGGMGVVYRAHDPALDREVAVKVLADRLTGHPTAVRRFSEEARVTGQLQHPAIPPVHEVGELPSGRPYLVMKLIRGRTLGALLAGRADPTLDRGRFLAVLEQVCQAVGYAHSRGVIHRDLKPDNVMVGDFGEVQVMDWGLAKVLPDAPAYPGSSHIPTDEAAWTTAPTHAYADTGEGTPAPPATPAGPPSSPSRFLLADHPVGPDSDRTAAGAVLGTPGYMAPEQARGEVDRLDRQTDVFGLGAMLCVILTGQPPYIGSGEEVLLLAAAGVLGPAYERLERAGADGELVGLAKRCLAPDPGDRPADANAVAEALAAYRTGVEARLRRAELERAADAAKTAELRKRRRTQAALGLSVLVVAGLVGFGAWWRDREWTHESAELARRQADTERDVTAAVREADTLLAQATRLADDPVRWEAAVTAARDAVRRAEGVLAAGVATDELRDEVTDARLRVEQADRDRRLIARLDDIAFQFLERENLTRPRVEYASAYAESFREYGLDPNEFHPDEFARRVAELSSREAVWEALIDWYIHLADVEWAAGSGRSKSPHRPVTRETLRELITRAVAGEPFWDGWWAILADPPADIGDRLAVLARRYDSGTLSPWAVHRVYCDLWNNGKRDDAVRIMRAGLKRYTSDYRLHARLGLNLRLDPRPEMVQEALRHCTAAVALRPKSLNAYLALADALRAAGQPEAGLPWVRKALDEYPTSMASYNTLGMVLMDAREFPEAARAFQRAIELDPHHPVLYANLGGCLTHIGEFQQAVATCRKALDLDGRHVPALNNLAIAQGYQLQFREAIATLRKALELDPDHADVNFNVSGFLLVTGDVEGALKHFRRAQELDPKYAKMTLGPPPSAPTGHGPMKDGRP